MINLFQIIYFPFSGKETTEEAETWQFSHTKENRDLSASKRTNVALILIKVRPQVFLWLILFLPLQLYIKLGVLLPEKLGRGVRPASQNPYPIYDQNQRFSLPYLWPDQTFDTLFMTWPLNHYPVSDLPYNYFPSSDQC